MKDETLSEQQRSEATRAFARALYLGSRPPAVLRAIAIADRITREGRVVRAAAPRQPVDQAA